MIVYWDLVLLTNIVVDFAFIKTIAVIYHEKLKWYRVVLALLLGQIAILLFFLPIKYLYNFRYIIGIFMGMIAYNSSKPLKKFLMIVCFYIINLVFIGSLVVFKINNVLFLMITMLYSIILIVLEKVIDKNLKIKYEYLVIINNNYLRGLLDTGNQCFYQGLPVVFLDNKWFNQEFGYLGSKKIQTINNILQVDIYQGPKLFFKNMEWKVLYSFSDLEDYDIILNSVMGE